MNAACRVKRNYVLPDVCCREVDSTTFSADTKIHSPAGAILRGAAQIPAL